MKKTVTVLGGGSWGTAFANLLACNGCQVKLWCFEQTVVDDIISYGINKKYLPDVELSKNIIPTSILQKALTGTSIIVEAIPVLFLRNVLQDIRSFVKKDQEWVVLSKGIERKTFLFPSQVISDVLGFDPALAIVSGPNLAHQVTRKKESAMVIASKESELQKKLAAFIANDYCRVSLSKDIFGVQVAGALKNVMTLFLGIADGSGYSENTIAFLVAQGIAEMICVAKLYGGKPETIYGISGLGDLVLGIIGEKSRNYNAGVLFGKGNSLQDLLQTMPVLPEGFNTIKPLHHIIQKEDLDLPLCRGIYQIVYEEKSVASIINELMLR